MIRLRLFIERVGWKRLLVAAVVVVALVAAGAVFAVVRGGGEAATTEPAAPEPSVNLFYLEGIKPLVRVQRCAMYIRFTWKPNYHADQYINSPALIMASGTDIEGTYRKTFKASGVSLDVGPVMLGGGYRIWSAKVVSLDGDPPGNDTTIQAAPPSSTKCA